MKVIWTVLFINLITVGLACVGIILYPADIKASLSSDMAMQIASAKQQVEVKTGELSESVITKKEPEVVVTPAPKRTPPPAKGSSTQKQNLEPTETAEFKGDYLQPILSQPPPPSLYPLSVRRRIFSDDNTQLTVELIVKNSSGFHFQNVSVFVKSSEYPRVQQFLIEEWRVDEIALLNYTFPSYELEERLKNLRIVGVTGDQVESAISEEMREKRQQMLEDMMTGDGTAVPESEVDVTKIVLIPADDVPKIPREPEFTMETPTVEDEKIQELFLQAHQAAFDSQQDILDFIDEVNLNGFKLAMTDGRGIEIRNNFRDSQKEFSQAASKLLLTVSRSKNEQAKELLNIIPEYSANINQQAKMIDIQIPVDQYRLQELGTGN